VLKLLLLVALGLLAARLMLGRWPWQPRGLAPRPPGRAQAQVLLGVDDRASRKDIIEAHRALVAQVHPDRGGTSDLVHEANAARDLLLGGLENDRREVDGTGR
jgi:DnaJ family protein C protein 19